MHKKNSILIVDDQKETRLIIKTALKNEGYFFEEATNGEEAIKKCRELKPNILLMDALMPVMDGFEATKALRMIDEFKYTPILMITSLTDKHDKIKALEYGVNDFISKPFNIHELKARCKSYMQLSLDAANRKTAELALKKQHEYLQCILNGIDDTVMVIKKDYTIELINNSIKNKIPKKTDMKNLKCYEALHNLTAPCNKDIYPCPLPYVMQTKKSTKVIHKDSNFDNKYIELSVSPLLDDKNNCVGIIEVGRDISSLISIQKKLKEQKNKLNYQAHHDRLTGLSNRVLFEDRLNQAILRAKRRETKVAIFFMDLNKFKPINDTYGHKVGDMVLKTVSHRIKKTIREEDTLSRIGGDEFTIIMEDIKEKKDSLVLAKKIQNILKEPIKLQEKDLAVSTSIGISFFPDDSSDTERLLTYADKAMYEAKTTKQNCPVFFDKKMSFS